jgi:hypothetical protein
VQQAEQIRAYRAAWKEAGHTRTPRVSVSRSIFALVNDMDRAYFGGDRARTISAISSREARRLRPLLRRRAGQADRAAAADEAIAEADTLLLTVPNQLGVAYNAHVIESILKHVAPASAGADWRTSTQPASGSPPWSRTPREFLRSSTS